MSWSRAYRVGLRLLPDALRRKHGAAMEDLFACEVARARARGPGHAMLAGAAGLWDLVRRGAYESARLRPTVLIPDALPGGPPMPQPTAPQLLRRLAVAFVAALVPLTAAMLALFAWRQAPADAVVRAVLLAVPFTAAMTIPIALLVAVLRECLRPDVRDARGTAGRGAMRRLLVPLLAASVGIAAVELAVTAVAIPRANARLAALLAGGVTSPSDRTMTIAELREAARAVPARPDRRALARAAAYEVELQKKLALPAACVVLALAGVAIARLAPRGGAGLVVGASLALVLAYYALLVTGEDLADRLIVSPVVGTWSANVLFVALATLALWWRARRDDDGALLARA